MSVAPHSGIVDFGTFTSPTLSKDGIQGEVPAPTVAESGYVLSTDGWVPAGGGGGAVTSVNGYTGVVVLTAADLRIFVQATAPSSPQEGDIWFDTSGL